MDVYCDMEGLVVGTRYAPKAVPVFFKRESDEWLAEVNPRLGQIENLVQDGYRPWSLLRRKQRKISRHQYIEDPCVSIQIGRRP